MPSGSAICRSRSENLGDVLLDRGNLEEALKFFRDGLAIVERFDAANPGNITWQRGVRVFYNGIGAVLARQGNLDDALKLYRDSLATSRRLAAAEPGNTEKQRDLFLSYDRIAVMLERQGKLNDALRFHRGGLAVAEGLVAAYPNNTNWQRDVSVSYHSIGGVLERQGNLDGALKLHRDSLAIRERLAADPSNTIGQRDLYLSYTRIGGVLERQGKLEEALKFHRDSLAINQRLAAANPRNEPLQNDLQDRIAKVGGMAFHFVLARDFAQALDVADQAIALAPDQIWLHSNRAHALLFLGRPDEARSLYLRYRGKDVRSGTLWEALIAEDFAELRKRGFTNPLMDEIEAKFAARG